MRIKIVVINKVSMLGVKVLADVNIQLQELYNSTEVFGSLPVVIFIGDFYQFPPIG